MPQVSNEVEKNRENRSKAQFKSAKKPIARLDSIGKKRSISKAFPPNSNSNNSTSNNTNNSNHAPASGTNTNSNTNNNKVFSPLAVKIINQSSTNPNTSTINLLNNMEGFGTDWYMRNVNLDNILAGIDQVDSRSLLNAINSTKKCVEAFYSDIRNLENEIGKAGSSTEITAIVSMFKSVYRHHIFNRFCQVQSRIDEDRKTRYTPQPINGGCVILSGSSSGVGVGNGNGGGGSGSNSSGGGGGNGGKEPATNHHHHHVVEVLSPVAPNLLINSVVSKAPTNYYKRTNSSSFMPNIIAKKMRQLTNGERKSTPVMYSIDLTDDALDKAESPTKSVVPNVDEIIEKVSEEIHRNLPSKDVVVDLCNDDDSGGTVAAYPVVRMNFNNQLYADNQS